MADWMRYKDPPTHEPQPRQDAPEPPRELGPVSGEELNLSKEELDLSGATFEEPAWTIPDPEADTTDQLAAAEAWLFAPTGPTVVDEAIEGAHRMNDEQPQSRKLNPSELQEAAAGLRAAVKSRPDAVKDLESAGRKALAALKEDERKEREGVNADWRERLLEPAQQLLDSMDALLADNKLWEWLRAGEAATAVLNPRSRLVLYEVLDQNLDELLKVMDVEPDQAERLAQGLKTALDDLLEEATPDEAMRAARTRSAQQHIAYVTHRLRSAIDAAKPQSTDVDAGLGSSPTRREPLRTRLRAAMWDGAQAALPAALAAGAVGLAFPPADHTAQAVGIAAGLSAKELLNKAVQLAGTGLMRRLPASGGSPPTAAGRFQGAKQRVDTALSDCVARLSILENPTDPSKEHLAECLRIESISAVYGLLQAQLDHAPKRHHAVRAVTDSVLDSLRQAGNLIGTLDRNPDDLSAVAQRLQTQRRELREVLQET